MAYRFFGVRLRPRNCQTTPFDENNPVDDSRSPAPKQRTFKAAFCRYFSCLDEDYEVLAVKKLLHRRGLPFALVLLKLKPTIFSTETKILRQLGRIEDAKSLAAEAQDLKNDYVRLNDFGFLRQRLRMRLSGRRLIKLAEKIWRETG